MGSTSICIALVVCVGAWAGYARAEAGAVPQDALPAGLSTHASGEGAAGPAALAFAEHQYYFQAEPAVASGAAKQSYWPLLYSALVPGLGELTMGYEKRGIALMAVEVAAWTGYFMKHSDGMDGRDAYEAFADQHWAQQKFIDHHPLVYDLTGWTQDMLEEAGQDVSGSGGPWYTGYIPWVSKEDDKQHYYENIGKYDWFVSGWSDYVPSLTNPQPISALRNEYVSMRNQSNDDLDTANSFVWVSLAARAFSIAETAFIIHKHRTEETQSSLEREAPFAVRARPRGFDGAELALEVRFK